MLNKTGRIFCIAYGVPPPPTNLQPVKYITSFLLKKFFNFKNFGANFSSINSLKKKLANNKKIKYHQNKIKKLDKVQRDLQANFADAQNDLAAAQATAQFTTDVSIRNQAEKAQRLIQDDIEKIQSTMADNEANLAMPHITEIICDIDLSCFTQDYDLTPQLLTARTTNRKTNHIPNFLCAKFTTKT